MENKQNEVGPGRKGTFADAPLSISGVVILNSSVNPFLYCWKMREVRQEVKNKIKQLWFL